MIFDVGLWNGILLVDRGFREVTESRSLNHVANGKALDSLVLGHATMAVETTHVYDVATVFLAASMIAALHSLV